MAEFNFNRVPIDSCNQNIQWNNSPSQSYGNSNCVQPFQRPPTPAVGPQHFVGFPHNSGQNRPPFSNVPPQAHRPEFSTMIPPNNQAFPVNINTPPNFSNSSDHPTFVRAPDPQNFPRLVSPQNFHGAHNSQNYTAPPGSQNYSGAPGSQNYSRAPGSQNFHGAPGSQNYSGKPGGQNFPGIPRPQYFSEAPTPQHNSGVHNFPGATGPSNFPGATGPSNFPGATGPQNFPGERGPQNFPGVPGSQPFPAAPALQNFPGPFHPPNFTRSSDSQNFPRAPDPHNFPRSSDSQNFPRPPDPQNFPRPPDPQNFPRPPDPQNFPRLPDPQNFPRAPDHQTFARAPGPQTFPGNPNFPRGPNFQNFPRVPKQPNFQGDSNVHNFSRAPDSQNFPRAHDPQSFQGMSGRQNFTASPNFHHPPGGPNAQNFHGEPSFDEFSQTSGSSPRPFTPWKQFSTRGRRDQFHNQSWESNKSQQFQDYSSQENKRGPSKVRNFKKLKEDNREKPFSCDTCDRAFETETDLKDHISQHITCDHVNCTFEAHPKIVALHKRMQHDTGYAERINKLKDDEEIKKWREERKRRFPTADNIKKRQDEQAEREARGEVLETKEFGKFKRRKEYNEMNSNNQKRRGNRFKRRNDRRKQFTSRSQEFTINVDSETDSDSDSHIKLNRFSGMLSLTNSAVESVKDVEVKDSTYNEADSAQNSNCTEMLNLSKNQSEDNVSQSAVPCSDSNSNNHFQNKTVELNDDKLHDAISSSVVEVSDDKTTKEQSIATIEDSDDEAPIAEPFVKCVEKSILTNGDFNEDKDDVNKSVCEIPYKSEMERNKNVEILQVADSDDEAPTVIPISKSFENSPSVDSKSDCQNKGDEESLTESSKAQEKVTENGYSRNSNRYNRYSRNQHNQLNGQDFVQVARKSSLLEKLLADDIRHERNVILQCIRHIVKNNFFGIENNTSK